MLNRSRFLALRDLNHRIDDIPFEQPDDTTSVSISADACAVYNEAFTRSIRSLFTMLKDKCDDDYACASHPGIALFLRSSPFIGRGSPCLLVEHDVREHSQGADKVSDSGEESDAIQYSKDGSASQAMRLTTTIMAQSLS